MKRFFVKSFSGGGYEHYEYDHRGNLRSGSPALNNVLYASRDFDTDLGLYFNRMRYYDPRLGRFTQKDLIFNRSEAFIYVANRPTIFIDPYGLMAPGPSDIQYYLPDRSGCYHECLGECVAGCISCYVLPPGFAETCWVLCALTCVIGCMFC